MQSLRHAIEDLGAMSDELCALRQKIETARQVQADAADITDQLRRVNERETQVVRKAEYPASVSNDWSASALCLVFQCTLPR